MMDKNSFLNKLSNVDNTVASGIYDKLYLACKTTKTIFTSELYTPNIWKKLEGMGEELGIGIYTYGVFKDAERKIIAFSEYPVWDYPVELLKISVKSKFVNLRHKDFLGSIMALGIKREKLGDLILKDDSCYLAVHKEISSYIQCNLENIARQTANVSILETNNEEFPAYSFQDILLTVSSLRTDNVIGALCNISRSKAEELIRTGKVLIDYTEALKKDKTIKENCVITVRGYGKFKFAEEAGWTGKGRIKILVKKFI